MAQDDTPEGATNDRPKQDTIAQSGQGLPDESRVLGEEEFDVTPDVETERRLAREAARFKKERP